MAVEQRTRDQGSTIRDGQSGRPDSPQSPLGESEAIVARFEEVNAAQAAAAPIIDEWIRPEEIGTIEVHPEKCEGCGVCEQRRPFDLPIRQMVRNAPQFRQPAAAA